MLLKDVDDFKVAGKSVKAVYLRGTPRWLPGLPIASAFSSEGQLEASVRLGVVASLSGGGALSSLVKPMQVLDVVLFSDGDLDASATPQFVSSFALIGAGALGATTMPVFSSAPTLAGSGTLSATAMKVAPIAASLSGGGTLAATVAPVIPKAVGLTGDGTLSASVGVGASAVLSGDGTLSATTSIAPMVLSTVNAPINATRDVSMTFPGYTPKAKDVLVAFPSAKATSAPMVLPSGWNNIYTASLGTSATNITEFGIYHYVTAAEESAGTVTWTLTNFFNAVQTGDVVALAVRYVSNVATVDSFALTASSAGGTSHTTQALGGAGIQWDNGLLIACMAAAGAVTYSTPTAGWTALITSGTNSGRYLMRRNALSQAGVGTTLAGLVASAGSNYAGFTLMLVPDFPGTWSQPALAGGGTLTATAVKV